MLDKFLILHNSNDLLEHFEMCVRFHKGKHDDKAHIAALRRIVHATPRNGMLEYANSNRTLVYMLCFTMGNRNVDPLRVQRRRVRLLTLMKSGGIGVLHPSTRKKIICELIFHRICIKTVCLEHPNEALVKMQRCHVFTPSLFLSTLILKQRNLLREGHVL